MQKQERVRAASTIDAATCLSCLPPVPLAVLLMAVVLPLQAQVQVRPDAGSLLESVRPPGQAAPQPPRAVLPAARPEGAGAPNGAAQVVVRRVVVDSAKLVSQAELESLVADLVGKTVSLDDLNQAAARITARYVELGYFLSRAVLPLQDSRDGTVRFRVIEAVYGRAETASAGVDAAGKPLVRLNKSRADQVLAAQGVKPGAPVQRAPLERGVLLLGEIPGIQSQANLSPGTATGSSDLLVDLQESALITGQVGADNLGGHYTGAGRVNGALRINDALGLGEVFRVNGLKSSGLNLLSAGAQAPVGASGWRVGVNAVHLDYSLCCTFAALGAKGQLQTLGLNASYPLILSPLQILTAGVSLERRHSTDETVAGQIANRRVNAATANLNWARSDPWGGLNSLYGAATFGRLDLSANAASQLFDAATARTQGSYTKVRVDYSRMQNFSATHRLQVRLSAQLASKNLDSSEKFSLGGSDGIRAFVQGEAAGDQAMLASVEYGYLLPWQTTGRLEALAFVDAGRTQLNKTTWPGYQGTRPGLPNSYTLSGAGVGLRWNLSNGLALQASLARQLGSNPGRLASGEDADGRTGRSRLLFTLNVPF